MSVRRHVLVVGTQCRNMTRLDRLESAATDLYEVLVDPAHGACQPGLPSRSALLVGELEQGEIEAAVRGAVEHAARRSAALVLALLGHGFVPGGQTTLHLMAAGSREGVANTGVNVPALLEAAVDRINVRGVIALVDTCNAAGAMPSVPALTAGSQQGSTRLDLLMASMVGRAAVDFSMTRALVGLLRAGVGDDPTLDLDTLIADLRREVEPRVIAFHRYNGAAGDLWLSRNPRVAASARRLGSYGYARYRTIMHRAFPELSELPLVTEAVQMMGNLQDAPTRTDLEDLLVVMRTVDLLRKPPLRDVITAQSLRRAARVPLPPDLFAPGSTTEAEVVAYLALNPPVGQSGRAQLLRLVLTLAADTGCDLDSDLIQRWIEELGLLVLANGIRRELTERRATEQVRLIVSLHASLTGDWPEVVTAWLLHGDEDVDRAQFPCSPTADGVTSAIFEAVDRAHDIAEGRGVTLRRVEVAAPTELLLSWRPEEIESGIRLGWDHDVVLHWSERLKQSGDRRRMIRSMRERLRSEQDQRTPFSVLRAADLSDPARLHEQLRNRVLRTAVALGCRPPDAESLLTLLLTYTPIVIWPDSADPGGDPTAGLIEAWHELPSGFVAAYRERWRDPCVRHAVADLRAVWDDETWLDFCCRMQWRHDRKDVA